MSIDFNGSDSYATRSLGSDQGDGPRSFFCRFRPDTPSTSQALLALSDAGSETNYLQLSISSSDLIQVSLRYGTLFSGQGAAVTFDQWHTAGLSLGRNLVNVAQSVDRALLYLDGEFQHKLEQALSNAGLDQLNIGRLRDTGAQLPFSGQIEDAAFWYDSTLTPGEYALLETHLPTDLVSRLNRLHCYVSGRTGGINAATDRSTLTGNNLTASSERSGVNPRPNLVYPAYYFEPTHTSAEDVDCHQGVIADPDGLHYYTIDDEAVYKILIADGSVVASNTDVFTGIGAGTANHLNDGDWDDETGELVITAVYWDGDPDNNTDLQILRFNPDTLAVSNAGNIPDLSTIYNEATGGRIINLAGSCVLPDSGHYPKRIIGCENADAQTWHVFNADTGAFIEDISWGGERIQNVQGVAAVPERLGGGLFIQCQAGEVFHATGEKFNTFRHQWTWGRGLIMQGGDFGPDDETFYVLRDPGTDERVYGYKVTKTNVASNSNLQHIVTDTEPDRFYRYAGGDLLVDLSRNRVDIPASGGLRCDGSAALFHGESQLALGCGSGKYAAGTAAQSPAITGDCTLQAAFRMSAVPGDDEVYRMILHDGADDTEAENALYSLGLVESDGAVRLRWYHENGAGTNNVVDFTAYDFAVDTTYLVHVVRDSVTKTLTPWVNGVEGDPVGYTNNATGGANALLSFCARSSGDQYFVGDLDALGIWSRKLTPREIQEIAASLGGSDERARLQSELDALGRSWTAEDSTRTLLAKVGRTSLNDWEAAKGVLAADPEAVVAVDDGRIYQVPNQ